MEHEWNEFIVGHDHTGKINKPLESHHLHNVGLKFKSEGDDPLRDRLTSFIKDTMRGVKSELDTLFESGNFIPHPGGTDMNSSESRSLAIGLAMYSNFARGAIYYGIRRGQDYIEAYEPRRLAANIIDRVITQSN